MIRHALNFAAILSLVFVLGAGDAPQSATDAGKGWQVLFDGTSTSGWRGLGMEGGFPADRWEVREGWLHCKGGKGKTVDLITVRKYENFEIVFQWMCPKPPGNSGVKYRVQERKGDGFAFGPEYQIMYDPDASDKHATGSLYDCIAPKGKKLRGPGEFNESRIVVRGDRVEHWLNDVKVVEFDFGSAELKAAVAKSKFKNTAWAKEPLGYIALQDHHEEVVFRNIRLRELSATGATGK